MPRLSASTERLRMSEFRHLTAAELDAGLEEIRRAPRDRGRLAVIVRRPRVDVRDVLEFGKLDEQLGLVGDCWKPDGEGDGFDSQLTLMNIRAADLVATSRERVPLAGDQLYVDFDLSGEHLPAGTRLAIGSAVVEVTPPPHTGCSKFTARFGLAAMKFVNSPAGRQLNLRGVNARVRQGGMVRVGDEIVKLVD
jgi:MOSC domain-containing protein YiiM